MSKYVRKDEYESLDELMNRLKTLYERKQRLKAIQQKAETIIDDSSSSKTKTKKDDDKFFKHKKHR